MNQIWNRFLRSAYRKEPFSSFIVTVGAVDAVIGGAGSRLSLMLLGLGMVGVAIALRWWIMHRRRVVEPVNHPAIRYLPAQSSRPQLPQLQMPPEKRK